MPTINPFRTGFAVGTVLVAVHAAWLLCVASGSAQVLLDWVFWMHRIRPVYTVEPFALAPAFALLVVNFAVGCLVGIGFALAWNRLDHRRVTVSRR